MGENITMNTTTTSTHDKALVVEMEKNISKLQDEIDMKNKQIAELMQLKKTNIELKKNISKLKNEITTLRAENEVLKNQNEEYEKLIKDLIEKSSNSTKEEYINQYSEWKRSKNNFFWSVFIGGTVCLVLGLWLRREKKKYEIPI